MTTTESTVDRATPATGKPRLRFDVIDVWAAEQGATTDTETAALLGIDKSNLSRLRKEQVPSLASALNIAAKIGSSVEEILQWGKA